MHGNIFPSERTEAQRNTKLYSEENYMKFCKGNSVICITYFMLEEEGSGFIFKKVTSILEYKLQI